MGEGVEEGDGGLRAPRHAEQTSTHGPIRETGHRYCARLAQNMGSTSPSSPMPSPGDPRPGSCIGVTPESPNLSQGHGQGQEQGPPLGQAPTAQVQWPEGQPLLQPGVASGKPSHDKGELPCTTCQGKGRERKKGAQTRM